MVNNQKGGLSMLKTLLSSHTGRIYVYLTNEDICKRFLQDAEKEGFTFTDGTNPTQKHTSDIIALNQDATINYVGFVGRVAFQAANRIGNQPLVKIDYWEFLKQSE
ncbi:MAG: hypothetical protein PUC88_04145 [Clostridia bacterium]|nr:hypothetical protein [Clostridia bacterium]